MKLRSISSTNDYLNFESVSEMLPSRHKRAFSKAYSWEPKLQSWKFDADESCKAVVSGNKPVAYGYRDDIIQELAERYGLEYNNAGVLFAPENEDVADLIAYAWGKWGVRSPLTHYVTGICLGYPVDDVTRFSMQYVDPSDELKKGLEKHERGDIIK
jgi:hypothetical protein